MKRLTRKMILRGLLYNPVYRLKTHKLTMEARHTVLILLIMTMFSRIKGESCVNVNKSEGNFSSFKHEKEGHKKVCWVLQVPSGRIELTFESFNFSVNDPKCDSNYVRVFDGEMIKKTLLRFRLCGLDPPQKIISSSKALFVEFRAAGNTKWAKFTANYKTIQDNELEYEIIRTEETWEGAFSKCRENNGYLVKTSNEEDIERLRQQIRVNEEVWVGTYTTPWLWTKACLEYKPTLEDRVINITRNYAAECQRQCGHGTEQVFLQENVCMCQLPKDTSWPAPYKRCNMPCEGDQSDVCGGTGVFMGYLKWFGKSPRITGISNHNNNCAVFFKPNGIRGWKTVDCDDKRQAICKKNEFDEELKKTSDDTYVDISDQNEIQYKEAVKTCLSEEKMIPDIENATTKLDKVESVKHDLSRGVWVGLRRRRVSVSSETVNVAIEGRYNSCYYMVLENDKMSTYVGNCSHKKSYYCKKANFIRTGVLSPTQTNNGPQPSTTTTDIGNTDTDESGKNNGTFHGQTTPGSSLSTPIDGVSVDPGDTGFPIKLDQSTTDMVVNEHVVIVCAGVAVLIVAIVIIVVICYRRRKKKNHRMQVTFKNATRSENPLINGRNMPGGADNKENSFAETAYPGSANVSVEDDLQNEEDGTYNLPGEIPTNSDTLVNPYSQELPTNGEYSQLPVKGGEKSRFEFDPYAEEKPENDTYNVLPVKGGPKPDPSFNPYAEEAPDNDTYNVLPVLGGPKVREDFDPYSDEKPDNDTYNVLPVKGQPKTNNDAIDDIYDHTGDNAETSQNVPMM